MRHSLILLVLATAVLTAQATKEVEITAEPHHRLVFENAQVRVFFVDVAPHTDTLMHAHRHDYIYVMLGASEVVNQVEGKPPVTAKLTDGQVAFIPGNFSHVVHNLDHPFRNLTVELLQDDKLRHSTFRWDATRGLEILHGGTAEILFVQDGIRVTEFELQPGGVVPTHHHAGPHLLVALTDLDIRSDVEGTGPMSGPMPGHFMSGQVKWLPGGYSHSITNTGQAPAKFVTLEFPRE
jgi:quercetin dioxygenase-like cupin family protein